ncbi:MAG: hypothetical protein FH756_03500 [Firmicutes bacterium]|nr:hypothetical protein [Bacillota bacterium]
MLFLLIMVFMVIIGLEFPPLIRTKKWRELMAVSLLMLVGMSLSTALVLGIPLPDPNKPFEIVFKPLVEWLMAE